jgi:hypothetical protein
MYVPFNEMHPESRLWIYQSSKPLTEDQVKTVGEKLKTFCETWAAHGQPLRTSFDIRYNHFIILSADENHYGASGCSIDESVRTIKQIDSDHELDLFNRSLVAFLIDGHVSIFSLTELKQKSASGTLKPDTLTFYNLVETKRQLEAGWLLPAGNSWLKRYLLPQKVTT